MWYPDAKGSPAPNRLGARPGAADRKEVEEMIGLFDILSIFGGPDSKEMREMGEDMRAAREKDDGRRMIIVALTALVGFAFIILGFIGAVFL